jgi:oligoendopeptidase F
MNALLLLAAVLAVGTPAYQTDLGRYFPDRTAEQSQRASLLAQVETFTSTQASSLTTSKAFVDWLGAHENLRVQLKKHDAYVYLLAERDSGDHVAEAADAVLNSAMDRLDAATERTLAAMGRERLGALMADPAVAPYRYFVEHTLNTAAHAAQNQDAVAALAAPALRSLADSYKSLLPKRRAALAAAGDPKATFEAKWLPFAQNEAAFAAILIPIVRLQDGKARLEGYPGAPEAAYASAGLSAAEVNDALAAIRRTDAAKYYDAVVAAAAAKRLGVAIGDVHAWNLQAADSYQPAAVAFPDAIPLILAAEQPMGSDYAEQYLQLFDPHAHRVEWCHEAACDRAGFSIGYKGVESALFYGSYTGDTDSLRAVAHEAGHAAHRALMNEHQKLAVYNSGPNFMFESFAIFNELLLLDHLYQVAPTPEAKAYYLHQFLDDVLFNLYGSAQETDLEQSIYAGVGSDSVHSAADLDAMTLKVFAQYRSGAALEPEMRDYWARNRLYFIDPLYDVNYLFAGLLAVQYLQQYEADPKGFSSSYVALLKNGFTDTPQALEKRFLSVDLDDPGPLVEAAAALIDRRTAELRTLYER